MIEQVHKHILSELRQNSRADTVFMVAAVLFNLVSLGINWGVADQAQRGGEFAAADAVFVLLFVGTLLINLLVLRALAGGRKSRGTLLGGLTDMYREHGVDKYYSADLIGDYATRYRLYMGLVLLLGVLSLGVPLAVRILG